MNFIGLKLGNGCDNFQCADLTEKIKQVSKIISNITEKYGPDEVFISFNGGKDCTVLLDLCLKYAKHEKSPRIFYIQPENPFPEVEEFIKSCEITYGIQIEVVQGKLKPALEKICSENLSLKAVIMGCRRTDPHCKTLETCQSTDVGWPKLLRVNPLLDWNYKEIWEYIKCNNIGYCKLYDEGYTSIGDRNNTKPNSNLLVPNDDGLLKYRPAWDLDDDDMERSGRS